MAEGYVILLYEGRDGHQVQRVGDDRDMLRYLQQSVRGHIEVVYPQNLPWPFLMLVNEEGLLRNMEINPAACWLYGSQDHGQPIVGPAVIVKRIWTDDGPDIGLLSYGDIAVAMTAVWKAHGHYWSWDLNTGGNRMSVYIKGMEMPTEGNETIIRIQPDGIVLDQYGHHLSIIAIPVPEHGRMIDADAFSEKILEIVERQKYDDFYTKNISVGAILRAVVNDLKGAGPDGFSNAPTIIPADKE